MAFVLDTRIAEGSIALRDLPLCHVRLADEARYPWLLLIPRRPDLADLPDLSGADAALLMAEIRQCAAALLRLPGVSKTNVATLGNRVRQMHVHVIGRAEGDATWPATVWDKGDAQPMDAALRDERIRLLGALIG